MSTEGIIVGTIVGVTVGVASAVFATKALKTIDENDRKEELAEAEHAAFNNGWTAASNNANNVRQSYVRLFETPDETSGTTQKGRKS